MIDLSPAHLSIVERILAEHVPECEVRAFGSRAIWNAKDYSDLDLAVVGESPLPHGTLTRLKEAFEESRLPMRVDVVDWHSIAEGFRQSIEMDCVVVREPARGVACCRTGDWERTTLGSIVDLLSGGTPSKRRADYWDGSFPWVSAKDMKQLRLSDTEDHLTDAGLESGTRVVPSGTVLLLTRGMTLLNDLPMCITERAMAFNQDVKALRPSAAVDGGFLPYLVLGNKQRLLSLVDLAGHGTGRLNSDELKALEVMLPPLEEQRAIARVLGALDDRIELNRRMSETLEEMARALFRSWFVDFDPVRAKAEGRPSGLPPDLDALFPASFEASELGEIPAGWEVRTLGDVARERRESVSPDQLAADMPYIGLDHMPRRSIVLSEWSTAEGLASNKSRFGVGDVLFGKLRPYFHKVGVAPVDGVCSTDIVVLAPTAPEWFSFVLGHASSDEFVDYTDAVSTGTKMPRTKWKDMARYPVALPGQAVAEAFNECIQPLVAHITWVISDSRSLAMQRDTLLPRLVTGALRIAA